MRQVPMCRPHFLEDLQICGGWNRNKWPIGAHCHVIAFLITTKRSWCFALGLWMFMGSDFPSSKHPGISGVSEAWNIEFGASSREGASARPLLSSCNERLPRSYGHLWSPVVSRRGGDARRAGCWRCAAAFEMFFHRDQDGIKMGPRWVSSGKRLQSYGKSSRQMGKLKKIGYFQSLCNIM